jgi:hypothetical protein
MGPLEKTATRRTPKLKIMTNPAATGLAQA